jgi:Zn-dependent M28 family amino/carboxypeptidase
MNPAHAEKILSDGGTPLSELLTLVDNRLPLPKFPLNLNFRAKVAIKHSQAESQNVVGVMAGSDPKLKSEYVVFSAHLDHVGIGEPINGDKIYNGAMDDASGVASLIEIANMMRAQKTKPKRSVIFLTVTGEEKGLLGSRYFSVHPTVPKEKIVADINMDMFLPLFPLHYLEVQGLAESTLGDDIREICQKAGIAVQADKEPDRNLFIRSDQYNFIRQGIPALAFKFGYQEGSPEEATAKNWLQNRYHAPSDDVNQPVDQAAAAQFNRILLDLGTKVANAKDRPQWKANSFFRRFAEGSN